MHIYPQIPDFIPLSLLCYLRGELASCVTNPLLILQYGIEYPIEYGLKATPYPPVFFLFPPPFLSNLLGSFRHKPVGFTDTPSMGVVCWTGNDNLVGEREP